VDQAADEIPGPASGFEDSRPEFAYGAEYLENLSDQRGWSLKIPKLSTQFSPRFVCIAKIVGKEDRGPLQSDAFNLR